MSKGELLVGLGALLLVALVGAIAGVLGTATMALIVAGGAYYIGFLTMGMAQAVTLWMVAGGAFLGAIGGAVFALFTGAMMG